MQLNFGAAGDQVLRAEPVVTSRVAVPAHDPFADEPLQASPADLGDRFRAIVDGVIFHNDENGYCVLSVSAGKGKQRTQTKCVGNIPQKPTEGLEYEFIGEWTKHHKFGKQFAFQSAQQVRPSDAEGILRYLASGVLPGVKESLAAAIVAHFGDRTLEMLDLLDERTLQRVPGIGPVKAQGIVEAWAEQEKYREVSIKLMQLGISAHLCVRIIKHFERLGQDPWAGVMEDPYCLTELWGVGFKTADRIGRSVGIGTRDERRLRAAAVFVLQQARDIEGHCFMVEETLAEKMGEVCELDHLVPRAWLGGADGDMQYLRSVVVEDDDEQQEAARRRHYLVRMHRDETVLAERLATLSGASGVRHEWLGQEAVQVCFESRAGYRLTEQQAQAVYALLDSRLGVLTGGPGTGKTTITRALVLLAEAAGMQVGLASPTGRAAKRLEEMTGHAASTIHRLLGWSQDGHQFRHSAEDPLPHDLIIVDEASMVDVNLARALADAIKPARTQLILVGDKDQLPSVGPGAVLNDVIRSGRATVCELTQIMRQAEGSGIVSDAHLVNQGKAPALATEDCTMLVAEDVEKAQRMVLALADDASMAEATFSLPNIFPMKCVKAPTEIQILTPMRKGPLGTVELNKLLQARLNPPGPGQPELVVGQGEKARTYRLGDRVLQTRNDYDRAVMNGDIGIVSAVDARDGEVTIEFAQTTASYGRKDLGNVDLAYAMTIHKSQGGEYPIVVVVCNWSHYVMLSRKLFYTAITRAKQKAIVVGEERAVDRCVKNNQSARRNTQLSERLAESG